MGIRRYFPSNGFIFLCGAVVVAAGLIYSATLFRKSTEPTGGSLASAAASSSGETYNPGQFLLAGDSNPTLDDTQNRAQALINESRTSNLTQNLGRNILLNATQAAAQGNADDPAVQGEIVDEALAQATPTEPSHAPYTAQDLSVEPDSAAALKTWGNAVVAAMHANPEANYNNTMLQVTVASNNQSSTTLANLPGIAEQYDSLAQSLISMPTPQSAAQYQLALANTFLQMGAACSDLQALLTDPARAIVGIQTFNTLYNTELSLLTQGAELLQSNGIIFDSSDPGHEWGEFLTSVETQSQTQPSTQEP